MHEEASVKTGARRVRGLPYLVQGAKCDALAVDVEPGVEERNLPQFRVR
jgi:hypothetical protein